MLLRSQRSPPASSSRGHWLYANLSRAWQQHFVDVGHCRLDKCRARVLKATDAQIAELAREGVSFLAMAVSAAAAYGAGKDGALRAYAEAIVARGLDPNDSHNDSSAVVYAAYCGFTGTLSALLAAGCALDGRGPHGHAVMAAVKNGQHAALALMLKDSAAARALVAAPPAQRTSLYRTVSPLQIAIERRDEASVRLLKGGGAMLSDFDLVCLSVKQHERTRFEPLLRTLYPAAADVRRWSAALHWSFPERDRQVLSLLWHGLVLRAGDGGGGGGRATLPAELWRHVFSFVERGWWASRAYFAQGRPWADVLAVNMLGGGAQLAMPAEYDLVE